MKDLQIIRTMCRWESNAFGMSAGVLGEFHAAEILGILYGDAYVWNEWQNRIPSSSDIS